MAQINEPGRPRRRAPAAPASSGQGQRAIRVAVVGGGCAGVAAAWEIASCPGFEVDLFEQGWRLGGKGASGRLPDGRIREHGLHLWLGFYENSFRLMRECYQQVEAEGWGPAAESSARLAHGRLEDAFIPEPHIGVGTAVDGFSIWDGCFDPQPGMPGQALDPATNPHTPASYMLRCFDLLKTLIQSTFDDQRSRFEDEATFFESPSVQEAMERLRDIVHGGVMTLASAINLGLGLVQRWLVGLQARRRSPGKMLDLLAALAAVVRAPLDNIEALDPAMREKTDMIDIVLAIAVGLHRDRLLFRADGFDAINDIDYRAWLARHGAGDAAQHSRFLTGIYEFAFAYEGGDRSKPGLAAGVALRSALRMFFTYRGAMFWRLRSGMGDTIFAPLYRALLAGQAASETRRARSPVRVHFMHRLGAVDVERADDGNLYVSRLGFATIGEEGVISSPSANALDRSGCWPDASDAIAPPGAAPGAKSLSVGVDFDAVVFAVGIDDLRLCFKSNDNLVDVFSILPPRWSAMERASRTVGTKAAQVWLKQDFRTMGWDSRPAVVTALGMTFETVADLSHTLASERAWRRDAGLTGLAEDTARSVAYLCSPLADAATPASLVDLEAMVHQDLTRFLGDDARKLWPAAFRDDAAVAANVVSAAVKGNATRSERYTLSWPGTIAARISPLDLAVANMTIAGDWTACGLDAGCVEGAVMSGLLASHAVTGRPGLASIVGYHHP